MEELQDQLSAQSVQTAEQRQQREDLQIRVEELEGQRHDAIHFQYDRLLREAEEQKAQYETMQADIMAAKKESERKTSFLQSCLVQSSASSHVAKIMLLSILGAQLPLANLLATPKHPLGLQE